MMNEPPSFTLSRSFYPKMFTKNVNGIKCHCTLNTFEKHKKCKVLNINENQLYISYKNRITVHIIVSYVITQLNMIKNSVTINHSYIPFKT